MNKINLLAIGDSVVDHFIELQDAKVGCDLSGRACEICFKFGDKLPYKDLKTIYGAGNSANASVSASRLGLKSALLAFLGNDENGEKIKKTLSEQNIITDYIKLQNNKKTNVHFVMRFGSERTILINHDSYEYSIPSNLPEVDYIYLSSMAKSSETFHDQIFQYLEKNPNIKLSFQPGTFQMKMGRERLKAIYQRTELFFVNVEEAQRILELPNENDIKKLLRGIKDLGVKNVFISDGPKGAYLLTEDNKYYFLPIYPDIAPPVERTGAGDAFASTITSYIAKGFSVLDAFMRGPINSMSVVQKIGPQEGLLSENEIEKYFSERPESYKVALITE